MQTVPSEFVCQLRPLMFVAGLGTEQQELVASTATSVSAHNDALSFQQLTLSLRRVFTARNGYAVYDKLSSKRKADFNVLLVEKNVRFPPRKARLQNGQSGPHSPISPFTPSSPLYPDGLIAPIWIRKHRDLIPSVFVLVLRLYEFGAVLDNGIPDVAEREIGPLEKEKLERLRDNELVNEVINRKRVCNERGIKLAVVLMASRELLDDPALDVRLSHIRRLSGLDSRASLFVLSPVPGQEVQNFVSSLQGELLESSIDYYREHGRRLRRKRARPANSNSSVSINPSTYAERDGTGTPHVTLNNAALNVRYEFKAATFAEFRAEVEVALKHYEDCYSALLDLFVSPASAGNNHPFILARTKRWAEARVLADCIIVKICKMYLYAGNAEFAALTYREHIRRITRVSADKWGIDSTTFEYHSWESKQHRIFADLLEAAMAAGFQLPQTPAPAPGPPLQARASAQHVPAQVLQHPGGYYLKAGLAAENRQRLFRQALEEYESSYSNAMTDPSIEEPPKMSAALAHEKSTSHSEQIIELYTKAYDHYKVSSGFRMTLSLAYLIAGVHHSAHTFATALRFDERIRRTYRRERWLSILDSILERDGAALSSEIASVTSDSQVPSDSTAYSDSDHPEAPQKTHVDLLREGLQTCMERIAVSEACQSRQDEPFAIKGAARSLLEVMQKQTASDESNDVIIELSSKDAELPFSVSSVFWNSRAVLGSLAPFQVAFSSRAVIDSAFENVTFESIECCFSDGRSSLVIENDNSCHKNSVTMKPDRLRARGNVRRILHDGVVMSSVTSDSVQSISVAKVVVAITIGRWHLAMHLYPVNKQSTWKCAYGEGSSSILEVPDLVSRQHGSSCSFEPRKLRLQLEVTAASPAYLDENFPIQLDISNNDDVDVTLYLDALLHPVVHSDSTSSEATGDYIQLEGGIEGTISISNALLAQSLPAGQSISRNLCLGTLGVPGDRTVDISVVARPENAVDKHTQVAVTEVTRQITIATVHPFFCDFQPTWYRPKSAVAPKAKSMLDLEIPSLDIAGYRLLLDVILGSMGPESLSVHGISLAISGNAEAVQLLGDTLEEANILSEIWEPEESFSIAYEFLLRPNAASQVGATLEITWSRLSSPLGVQSVTRTTTRIPLPTLALPPLTTAPQVVAHHPPSAILHKPFKIGYALECPADWGPAPMLLTFEMESGSENFVFAGPRKIQHSLVLHEPDSGPHHLAEFTLIPIGNTATVDLPRFRCWHILETPLQHAQRLRSLKQTYFDPETGQSRLKEADTQIRVRELKVVESRQEIIVGTTDEDDAAPLGQPPLRIYILPR